MEAVNEITLPEAKPALEWVRGRALQKMSPRYRHARLQALLAQALTSWAYQRGRVGTEWNFRVNPPGEPIRPLVPDVAYLSYRRVGANEDEAAQIPLGAPNAAVEVLSPGDRKIDIADKIATYLRAGCDVVIVVNPRLETIAAHDAQRVLQFVSGDTFTHPALEGFTLDVAALFEAARH
jgi:Uma2 family endonuclease